MNNENFTYLYYKAFADRYEDRIYSISGGGKTTPSQKKRAETQKEETMKTKKEIAEHQIELQSKMQSAGFNLVTCGNCGSLLIHEVGDETIDCFCGQVMDVSDCPDYWYEGLELSEEFKD